MASHERHCDLVVVGSGAAGLAAAVTAAHHGLEVIVVEKENVLGGATAWSGGWLWIPRNRFAREAGIDEDVETIRTYLRNELGERFDATRIDAFLDAAPRMVDFFQAHTALAFNDGNAIPDIHGDAPGAGNGGRSVIAAPFDARELGQRVADIRRTMPETAFLGMPIQAGPDLMAFLSVTRSWRSARHVARRVTRHLYHLARYGRAMHWVNGVALIGRLVKSADTLGVETWTASPARRLVMADGRAYGVTVATHDGEQTLHARRGVILAAGGFPHDVKRRRRHFPRTPTGREHLALPPEAANGDGITLGESAGGRLSTGLASPAAWCPVSAVPYRDGRVGHFPHIIDRGKPGIIGVLADGRRFVNEAHGYYDYVAALIEALPEDQPVESWLICDHRFLRRYGLGIVRPVPVPFGHWIRRGYLKRGRTLEQLAAHCGIDAAGLAATVEAYNAPARHGEDPEFGRGSTPYNRKQGDPLHRPNPCVAPIERGPFYAVKVVPGSFGTFAGLETDAHARVLAGDNTPIAGLYAAGTDMASIMGGFYPAGGVNLGPAMTFGYIAARHAAGLDADARAGTPPKPRDIP
ncbi:FAD-dependent oxidoreductase [Halomonas sp. IOP_31]|uniref:FAD-dependent oxidoreductase n=1 Tax=Halomonas sp. IOP_31 TaxID=2876584 RepID=UPI001E2A4354|nr:FAD-dependent oxidoreductase [Halomonas sp. IOP_31]MCD6008442.1 FAD-dependent oxidoreductase [Halomonas sp. IOP_31]